MISPQSQDVATRAKLLYEEKLRDQLEREHRNQFVAIEPDSGDYFLGETYGEAVRAARQAHPNQISFVLRVGHDAAIHLGGGV